jgi:hypothetical protein
MSILREARVDIGGRVYSIISDDNYLEHIEKSLEPEMVKLFIGVARGSVILDDGANIGCTAISFGELAKTVYVFDLFPTSVGFLERSISSQG